jgi:hypothetical protein
MVLPAQYFAEFEQKARLLSYFDRELTLHLNADRDGQVQDEAPTTTWGGRASVLRPASANQACVIRMQ